MTLNIEFSRYLHRGQPSPVTHKHTHSPSCRPKATPYRVTLRRSRDSARAASWHATAEPRVAKAVLAYRISSDRSIASRSSQAHPAYLQRRDPATRRRGCRSQCQHEGRRMTADGDAGTTHAHHLACLHSPIGAPGSGAGRYAAAMYFYQQGVMSAELLEIFRC